MHTSKMVQNQNPNLNSGDVFEVLAWEDKLDGTKYSMWSFMVNNVLVGKSIWGYVRGDEACLVDLVIASATPL